MGLRRWLGRKQVSQPVPSKYRLSDVPPGSNRASSGGGGRVQARQRVRYVPPRNSSK